MPEPSRQGHGSCRPGSTPWNGAGHPDVLRRTWVPSQSCGPPGRRSRGRIPGRRDVSPRRRSAVRCPAGCWPNRSRPRRHPRSYRPGPRRGTGSPATARLETGRRRRSGPPGGRLHAVPATRSPGPTVASLQCCNSRGKSRSVRGSTSPNRRRNRARQSESGGRPLR